MQSRLDGYRNATGAIFLAVVASTFTFDTTFVKLFLDSTVSTSPGHKDATTIIVVGGIGAIVVVVGLIAVVILGRIARYFAEMTSIIYKIDVASEAWTVGAYIENAPLYPLNFQLNHSRMPNRVGVATGDSELIGWPDPAIRAYYSFTIVLTALHAAYYGALSAKVTM